MPVGESETLLAEKSEQYRPNRHLEKSMKVSKTVETPGYFWLPETPDEKTPGVLSVSKHGEISVDLVRVLGDYVSEVNLILNLEHQGISRVSGIVRDGGHLTLTACNYLSFESNLAGGLDKVILGAQTAFVGADFQQGEIAFTEYDFWVEGLSEWLNQSGITTTTDISTGSGIIEFHQPDPIPHILSDGTTMKFDFASTGPSPFSINALTDVRVTQTPFVSLSSTEPRPIEYFNSLATKLTKFLTLVVDQNVQIQSIKVHLAHEPEEDGHTHSYPIRLYHAFHPTSDSEIRVRPHEILFSYPAISDFSNMINMWLENYDPTSHANALDSYFASRSVSPLPPTTRFLNLCQSMEALHGKMFPDERIIPTQEFVPVKAQILKQLPPDFPDSFRSKIGSTNYPSLRDRLESLVGPVEEWFGGSENSKIFAKQVADTRNYLTHLQDRGGRQARNSQELRDLYAKLDALATLRVLMLLGLDKRDLTELTQGTSNRLNQVLTVNDSD